MVAQARGEICCPAPCPSKLSLQTTWFLVAEGLTPTCVNASLSHPFLCTDERSNSLRSRSKRPSSTPTPQRGRPGPVHSFFHTDGCFNSLRRLHSLDNTQSHRTSYGDLYISIQPTRSTPNTGKGVVQVEDSKTNQITSTTHHDIAQRSSSKVVQYLFPQSSRA